MTDDEYKLLLWFYFEHHTPAQDEHALINGCVSWCWL